MMTIVQHSAASGQREGDAQPLNTWEQAASWVAEAVAAAREQNGNAGLPDAGNASLHCIQRSVDFPNFAIVS